MGKKFAAAPQIVLLLWRLTALLYSNLKCGPSVTTASSFSSKRGSRNGCWQSAVGFITATSFVRPSVLLPIDVQTLRNWMLKLAFVASSVMLLFCHGTQWTLTALFSVAKMLLPLLLGTKEKAVM